ncbi:MAG: hypothetical protein LUO93_08710 [Methanomicrobiales archaeon]|nr:hypothetical protein [Methanomicrobiales archaeon]
MPISRAGYGLVGLIVLLFILVTAIVLSDPSIYDSPLGWVVRLSALYGFLMTAIAAISTSYLVLVARTFGRPFIRVHHTFAVLGFVLFTVHPFSYAFLVMTPAVFIPSFRSWIDFWANGGRVALILFYIAVAGSLLHTRWKRWRYAHTLMYVALLLAIVHANLIGTDFTNGTILWIYNISFGAVVAAFLLNMRRKWRLRPKISVPGSKGSEADGR